jgi:hypothetical protein
MRANREFTDSCIARHADKMSEAGAPPRATA